MDRQEHGTGYDVSKLTLILVFSVIYVIVTCGAFVIMYASEGYDEFEDPFLMYIEEFYNSSNSEDACVSMPILYENGNPVQETVELNNECKSAYESFKTMYPDASALYVIHTSSEYNEATMTHERHFDVKVVDINGNSIDEISRISVPYEYIIDPYNAYYHGGSFYYAYFNCPKFDEIRYGLSDRGGN